jgi:hypothetical protein
MSYYGEKRKLNNWLETVLRQNNTIDLAILVYQATKLFEVGDLAVKRQIKLLCEIGMVELKGDEVRWKEKKEKVDLK